MMCGESHFPPGYDQETGDKLLDAVEMIMQRCCSEECIIPLLIIDKEKTCRILDTVGCLYQCILTSVRLSRYRRAMLYLCALERYCEDHFPNGARERVLRQISDHFLK